MTSQAVQVAGALLVLAAFAAAQRGLLPVHSRAHPALNLAGSAVLAVLAAVGRQWGFLLLEGAWAAVSGWGLLRAGPAVHREGRAGHGIDEGRAG